MSPKAVGVHSDWGFLVDALCDRGRFMERDRVWSGLTNVGVIGWHNEVV